MVGMNLTQKRRYRCGCLTHGIRLYLSDTAERVVSGVQFSPKSHAWFEIKWARSASLIWNHMISDNYNYHFTTSILKMQNTLSPWMTWQAHISWIVNKLNQRLRVLRRVKLMLSLQYRLTLYNSLVLPLFDYGDIFWSDTLIENLHILHNKAAKIILDRHSLSSASEALDSLGCKPLHLRRSFHRCTTIFRCLNGFNDFHFHFVRNNTIYNYNKRSRDDFHLHVGTNCGKQRFMYQSVVDWNSLSQDIYFFLFYI